MKNALYDIEVPSLDKIYSGKVRELFSLTDDSILLVATDRVSAFDYVLPTPIPEKGGILTKISVFWFDYLKDVLDNHIIEHDFSKFPENLQSYSFLRDRSVIVKRVRRIPVECVVRGYLVGSGWEEYKRDGTVCGISLPEGLREADRLPEPLFTPATKAEKGEHDMNISFQETENIVGRETAHLLREKSIKLYEKAVDYALEKGIIIADTKFEFGFLGDRVILIDEVFTPDSSRFWEKEKYAPGNSPESLDKQYIRDYLISAGWDRVSPPPTLPEDVVNMTVNKYKQIYHILTG